MKPINYLISLTEWSGFDNRTGLDAVCTDTNPSGLTILQRSYSLKVGVPYFFGFIMSMAYAASHIGLLSADFTNF